MLTFSYKTCRHNGLPSTYYAENIVVQRDLLPSLAIMGLGVLCMNKQKVLLSQI